MFNYNPLFKTLDEKGMKPIDLENGCGLSSSTMNKFKHNKNVEMNTIARVCQFLNVPINKVVEVKR